MQERGFNHLEQLREVHRDLLADLQKLEEAMRGGLPQERLPELRRWLEQTRRHVAEHFRLEEQDGYLEPVRKRDPRLERRIRQLAEQHRQLTHSLDALIAQAAEAHEPDERIMATLRRWIADFRNHEIQEDDLIQDAFQLDLGAAD